MAVVRDADRHQESDMIAAIAAEGHAVASLQCAVECQKSFLQAAAHSKVFHSTMRPLDATGTIEDINAGGGSDARLTLYEVAAKARKRAAICKHMELYTSEAKDMCAKLLADFKAGRPDMRRRGTNARHPFKKPSMGTFRKDLGKLRLRAIIRRGKLDAEQAATKCAEDYISCSASLREVQEMVGLDM